MSTEDPGFWKTAFDYLWIPFGAGVGIIWTMLTGQIKEVKETADAALSKERFNDYLDDQREYRSHRENIDERIDRKLDDVHKELRDVLMEMRK